MFLFAPLAACIAYLLDAVLLVSDVISGYMTRNEDRADDRRLRLA